MYKNLIVYADHFASNNDLMRPSQITRLDCNAAQGAPEYQTHSFPTKQDGDTVLLAL
jgi:hypothetical protein